ncbi:DNA topoisomerase IB [Sphingomonas sp. MAH-20]|uniref:DNA topoisomerase n=1 Tax=Sphingomonas horti TaxID=2682842 RepID=A0A6I4IY81_9SPHN|nr:DNA topoisomerase IB [Sphingomonas sp. CGMCC 1.13658]MBA2918213.1 DNA topoisomerase IB [Sphingomonas sp. CGMCC 1.13658]MVO77182.1 DNA topoisomerase IB [Sphingomonas horti]
MRVADLSTSHLSFVDDEMPGITRRRIGRAFGYFSPEGQRITDRDEIDRLNGIGLPPAYTDAWFCPDPHGHIQAIGWDERGRKQYRYHPDFRAAQDAAKYDRCAAFGEKLPRLRARVEKDLKRPGLGKEKACAAVVRLLDLSKVRIGNEAYAQDNRSFGATTLRKRHVDVKGRTLKLEFRAKSGKICRIRLSDASLLRFVKRMQDLRGQHLFRWIDDEGTPNPVTSTDVNAYIREAMDADFTAKHFRTWGASVVAFRELFDARGDISLKAMLAAVSDELGNTPAIARKSYVHPALIDLAKSGAHWDPEMKLPRSTRYLHRYERGLIAFLNQLDDAAADRRAAA